MTTKTIELIPRLGADALRRARKARQNSLHKFCDCVYDLAGEQPLINLVDDRYLPQINTDEIQPSP